MVPSDGESIVPKVKTGIFIPKNILPEIAGNEKPVIIVKAIAYLGIKVVEIKLIIPDLFVFR